MVRNVPRIKDVEAMVSILEALGVRVSWLNENELSLCSADLSAEHVEIPQELAERIRASFLLAGPLLARFGRVVMPRRAATSSAAGAWIPTSTPSGPWGPSSSTRRTSNCGPRAGCAPGTCSWTSPR